MVHPEAIHWQEQENLQKLLLQGPSQTPEEAVHVITIITHKQEAYHLYSILQNALSHFTFEKNKTNAEG